LKGPLEEGTSPFGLLRELGGPYRRPHGFFDQEQSAVTCDLDYRRTHSDRSLGLAIVLAMFSLKFVHRRLIFLQRDNEGGRKQDIRCFAGTSHVTTVVINLAKADPQAGSLTNSKKCSLRHPSRWGVDRGAGRC
jgi:hypothetical protein